MNGPFSLSILCSCVMSYHVLSCRVVSCHFVSKLNKWISFRNADLTEFCCATARNDMIIEQLSNKFDILLPKRCDFSNVEKLLAQSVTTRNS